MKQVIFQKITKDLKNLILTEAEKNDWLWFYDLHQKEVVRCAEKLLKIYKANRQIVIIACWLHDISKYQIKSKLDTEKFHKTHHIDSCEFSKKFLAKYEISDDEREKICNCVLRHRNTPPPTKQKQLKKKSSLWLIPYHILREYFILLISNSTRKARLILWSKTIWIN